MFTLPCFAINALKCKLLGRSNGAPQVQHPEEHPFLQCDPKHNMGEQTVMLLLPLLSLSTTEAREGAEHPSLALGLCTAPEKSIYVTVAGTDICVVKDIVSKVPLCLTHQKFTSEKRRMSFLRRYTLGLKLREEAEEK